MKVTAQLQLCQEAVCWPWGPGTGTLPTALLGQLLARCGAETLGLARRGVVWPLLRCGTLTLQPRLYHDPLW